MRTAPDVSTPELVGQALSQTSTLIREELRLARAELSESAAQAVVAIGLLVGAVVVALVSLNVLAAALVAALGELGLADGWAALIVGCTLTISAFLMAQKGVSDLKAAKMAPTRAFQSVKQDARTLKDAANG